MKYLMESNLFIKDKKYIKLFEDNSESIYDRLMQETLDELPIKTVISYNVDDILKKHLTKEMLLSDYGTDDVYLITLFFNMPLGHNKIHSYYFHHYRVLYWEKCLKEVVNNLKDIKGGLLGQVLKEYAVSNNLNSIGEKVLSYSNVWEGKLKELEEKVNEEISKYLLQVIIDEPIIYHKNKEDFDRWLKDRIPSWLKRSDNTGLLNTIKK